MIAYDINKDSNVKYSIVSSIRKHGSVGKDKEKMNINKLLTIKHDKNVQLTRK